MKTLCCVLCWVMWVLVCLFAICMLAPISALGSSKMRGWLIKVLQKANNNAFIKAEEKTRKNMASESEIN